MSEDQFVPSWVLDSVDWPLCTICGNPVGDPQGRTEHVICTLGKGDRITWLDGEGATVLEVLDQPAREPGSVSFAVRRSDG